MIRVKGRQRMTVQDLVDRLISDTIIKLLGHDIAMNHIESYLSGMLQTNMYQRIGNLMDATTLGVIIRAMITASPVLQTQILEGPSEIPS